MANFCNNCGAKIENGEASCPSCGKKVVSEQPIVVNVENHNVNAGPSGKKVNKWVAFLLCCFLGGIGAHKFYEGRIGMGILYFFTFGLFGIGCFIDFFAILFKSNPYYV